MKLEESITQKWAMMMFNDTSEIAVAAKKALQEDDIDMLKKIAVSLNQECGYQLVPISTELGQKIMQRIYNNKGE